MVELNVECNVHENDTSWINSTNVNKYTEVNGYLNACDVTPNRVSSTMRIVACIVLLI